MTAALPSYYVPDIELEIQGQPVPADMRASVTRVHFDESLGAADRVEVGIANQGLRFLDHPLLRLGNGIELSLGYRPDGVQHVFKGEITGVDPSFPAAGMPTVTISAHDFMFRLTKGTKTRSFPWFLPDSVIVGIVAGENFLIPQPDVAAAALGALNVFNHRPRSQHNTSDQEFLSRLAAEYGFDIWVDGDVMNFRYLLPQMPPPEVELHWGESLIEFTPHYTSIGEVMSASLGVWVQEIKTEVTVSATWDGDRLGVRVTTGCADQNGAALQPSLGLPDIPLDSPADALKWVMGEMRRRINNRTTGKGTAVGDPRLRIGQVITLSGLGQEFSGRNYRLTAVSHGLDSSGYRTGFEVRRELV